jgi:intracellular septation protein A
MYSLSQWLYKSALFALAAEAFVGIGAIWFNQDLFIRIGGTVALVAAAFAVAGYILKEDEDE